MSLKELHIPNSVLSMPPRMPNGTDRIVFYASMIAKGESPRMAETLATQTAPGIGITADIYIADQNRHGRTIYDRYKGNMHEINALASALAKQGYKLKPDDHYVPTAARFFGDPAAVVSHGQGSLKQLSENTAATVVKTPSVNGKKLNKKIVDRIAERKLSENPDLKHRDSRELRETIVDKHGTKAL